MQTIEEKMKELMALEAWNKKDRSFEDLEKKRRYYKVLKRAVIPETKKTPK